MNDRKKIIRFWIFFFCLVLSDKAFSQLNQNNLVHYPQIDGTIIYCVMPDRLGNIWLATQNGLVCFNGYEFKRFFPDRNDTASISNILVYSLLEDNEGKIWIGGMDAVDVYDPVKRTFSHLSLQGLVGIPDNGQPLVLTLNKDRNGRIYLGITSGYGFSVTHAILFSDPGEYRLQRFKSDRIPEIQNVNSSTADDQGNLWFFCTNGLIKIFNDEEAELIPYITDPIPELTSFRNIPAPEWDQLIWVANNSFLYCYSPVRNTFKSFNINNLLGDNSTGITVYSTRRDSLENLWIGSSQGMIFYDRLKDRFNTFPPNGEKAYVRDQVSSFQSDSFGNLWIGTHSNGLLKYNDRTTFNSIIGSTDEKAVFRPGWVGNLYESTDGMIWFRSAGDGEHGWQFYKMDPTVQKLTQFEYWKIVPGLNRIYLFLEASPGKFLVSTNHGMYYYFPSAGKMERVVIEGLSDELFIQVLFRDREGDVWFAADGLYLLKDHRVVKKYDLRHVQGGTPSSNTVSLMVESENNIFWLLSNDGLYHFDHRTDKIERVGYDRTKGDVFLSQDINSLYEGPDSVAWVGTWLGGLSRYDMRTGNIKTYKTGDGLPSMSIQGILADEKSGVLWLSTFDGISRFDIRKERFDNFSLEDGIHGQLFSENTYLKTSKGLFIFGGNNGITFFNPDQINFDTRPPNVYITDFKVADASVPNGQAAGSKEGIYNDGEYRLKFFQHNISINYVGIHYANPARNRFAFKLDNYDEGWREVGNQRTAYYYNLPAGNYTFRVKAANSNGVWNETGASMHFVISPPWWRTWWAYSLYGMMLLGLALMIDRIQRRRVEIRERALAREKELAQAREIEKAYRELQATQAQLIHAEKLASLGELTAGVAHEIQNPLNFVNNFSEVSVDLLEEIESEVRKGHKQVVKELAADLKDNLQKISHHGKRASSIVKGMLEHSRSGTGQKQPTDINVLAEEYLRLAYHGIRARNKSFGAEYRTDFDANLPRINVVPQEIGRVLLNLINNAFYAVDKKRQHVAETQHFASLHGPYTPTVTVITRNLDDRVEIRVKDNGDGIPAELLDKIFQPFFTTKPTGEGTGLGLSLSYDIITKGHQGEIKVETKAGEGTEFIIRLNVS